MQNEMETVLLRVSRDDVPTTIQEIIKKGVALRDHRDSAFGMRSQQGL